MQQATIVKGNTDNVQRIGSNMGAVHLHLNVNLLVVLVIPEVMVMVFANIQEVIQRVKIDEKIIIKLSSEINLVI